MSAPGPLHQSSAAAQPWHQHTDPRPRRAGRVINILLLCLLALVLLGTLAYFAVSLGASVFGICGALALVPLALCLLTLHWIDRWDPEPNGALLFAFCWGAGMSVVTSLVLGSWVQPLLLGSSAGSDPHLVSAVIQAPLVEETSKGLGVLLLFFLRRKTFDGPVDGVVYAGTIAAGFAFTENILYFGSALSGADDASGGLLGIFLVRGLMSPFAHVMFTSMLGAIVGFAARRGSTGIVVGAWVVGLVPAMFLHGLWNSTSLMGSNFLIAYGALQVPIFIAFVLGVVFLRRAETKLTQLRLADYVPSGWFTEAEVPMLVTAAGRRRALHWANGFGAGKTMREFIRLATRLAFTRQRIVAGAAHGAAGKAAGSRAAARFAAAQADELALLQGAAAVRAALLALHGAAQRAS
ncbi:PrsW family intramembrane metalloprotease [Specibacter cremeus]|uniref:PrsW family intramembrane metalloprotease n=1 Tax=Specibacter cremeus TaxID=1629051 RepID=UPI000F77033A|nr:PrsW family intramembrane metalloprotease [Specibacter cremeus]